MKIILINGSKSLLNAVETSIKDSSHKIFVSKGFTPLLEEIPEIKPDVILIHWSKELPDIAHIIKRIRKVKSKKYINIITILPKEKIENIQKLFSFGLDDFIIKPFSANELKTRIALSRQNIKIHTSLNKSKKDLMKLARDDKVTGLFNRRALMDEGLKEMNRSSRDKKFFSSIMIDIVNYDELLNEFGQAFIDLVLVKFTGKLRVTCRPYDKVGRYTFSQFLLFLPDTSVKNTEKVAIRLLKNMEKEQCVVQDRTISLKLAIGISEIDPDDISKNNGVDDMLMNDLLLDSLIRRSQLAVKKSASEDGNTIKIYTFDDA